MNNLIANNTKKLLKTYKITFNNIKNYFKITMYCTKQIFGANYKNYYKLTKYYKTEE